MITDILAENSIIIALIFIGGSVLIVNLLALVIKIVLTIYMKLYNIS